MAMTDEELKLQMNILASKISDNPNMTYKTNAVLNKGLNPDYFSGNYTKVVNALNQLAANIEIATNNAFDVAQKVNDLLIDTSNVDNLALWEQLKTIMGRPTIVQGLLDLYGGTQISKVLNISESDIGKVLSVDKNDDGDLIVKAIEQAAAGEIDPPSLETLDYTNRFVNEITNAKEALDYAINAIANGEWQGSGGLGGGTLIGEITWDMIDDRPTIIADGLMLTSSRLELMDGERTVSSVELTSDSDIEEIMDNINLE